MADADPDPRTKAEKLADWTNLSGAKLGDCYVSVWSPGPAAEWQVIVGLGLRDEKLITEVCREAEKGDFLDRLARAVANWEKAQGRSDDDITAMLDEVADFGLMQGMTNQQKGFMNAEILLPMLQAREACAIIVQREPVSQQLGTGFLVRPDLVLTAAHVVMDIDPGSGGKHKWASRLKPGLAFIFKARPNQPTANRVEVRAASQNALASFALPHGDPPNRLDKTLTPPDKAATQLDYALIRLAQRVEHVLPVEILDTATVELGKPCWAFGFPGGDSLMMDVDLVEEVSDKAGRWIHLANAAAGMSGGCCINHVGQIAGIHEGTLDVKRGNRSVSRNRGVSISAIRAKQRQQGKDPFSVPASAPGLEFQNRALVEELYRAGLRLGGEVIAREWKKQVNEALQTSDVESDASIPPFHPWFYRDCVERWIGSNDRAERLCMVYGESGAGKSFCARILRERREPTGTDVLWLTPTHVTAMSWSDAISHVMVVEGSQYRTAAAAVRYRDFEEVIDEMRARSAQGTRDYFVAIDFGPPGDQARFAGTQWVEFVAALAAQEWIRILLIDLDPFERAAMIDRLGSKSETEDVIVSECEIRPLGRDEFIAYARRLASARGQAMKDKELRALVDKVLPPGLDFSSSRQLQTVSLALAAIAFEAALP